MENTCNNRYYVFDALKEFGYPECTWVDIYDLHYRKNKLCDLFDFIKAKRNIINEFNPDYSTIRYSLTCDI